MSTTYGDRLDAALRLANTDRQTLADQLGISVQAIGQVIAGKTKALTAENSAKAAKVLGVSGYWLATGEGAIDGVLEAKPSAVIPWPFARIREADLRALSADDRTMVEGALALAIAQVGIKLDIAPPEDQRLMPPPRPSPVRTEAEAANDTSFVAVRRMELKISAGLAGYSIDPQEDQGDGGFIYLARQWIERRDLIEQALLATTARGSSMFPRVHDGDIVLVNTANTTRRGGGVYALNHEGEFTLKRLQWEHNRWWLYSDNPDQKTYAPVMASDRTTIIGKVVLLYADEI